MVANYFGFPSFRQYNRNRNVDSLPCSKWERVLPTLFDRQPNLISIEKYLKVILEMEGDVAISTVNQSVIQFQTAFITERAFGFVRTFLYSLNDCSFQVIRILREFFIAFFTKYYCTYLRYVFAAHGTKDRLFPIPEG